MVDFDQETSQGGDFYFHLKELNDFNQINKLE
jgi:hypothetical protein